MAKSKPIGVHGTDKETGRKRAGDSVDDNGEKLKKPDISKEDFTAKATPLNLGQVLNGRFVVPTQFASGSFGYEGTANQRVTVMIEGKSVQCMVLAIRLIVVHSKEDTSAVG